MQTVNSRGASRRDTHGLNGLWFGLELGLWAQIHVDVDIHSGLGDGMLVPRWHSSSLHTEFGRKQWLNSESRAQ